MREFTGVVEEIGMSFKVGHTTVVGERVGLTEGHDLTGICPWSKRTLCRAVTDMLGHSAGSIQQLVGTVALGEPWSFYVGVLVLFSFLPLVHDR